MAQPSTWVTRAIQRILFADIRVEPDGLLSESLQFHTHTIPYPYYSSTRKHSPIANDFGSAQGGVKAIRMGALPQAIEDSRHFRSLRLEDRRGIHAAAWGRSPGGLPRQRGGVSPRLRNASARLSKRSAIGGAGPCPCSDSRSETAASSRAPAPVGGHLRRSCRHARASLTSARSTRARIDFGFALDERAGEVDRATVAGVGQGELVAARTPCRAWHGHAMSPECSRRSGQASPASWSMSARVCAVGPRPPRGTTDRPTTGRS